jgi:hypothetical protein
MHAHAQQVRARLFSDVVDLTKCLTDRWSIMRWYLMLWRTESTSTPVREHTIEMAIPMILETMNAARN